MLYRVLDGDSATNPFALSEVATDAALGAVTTGISYRASRPATSNARTASPAVPNTAARFGDELPTQTHHFAPQTARNSGNYGGEFLDDAIRSPVVRPDLGSLSSKIQRQMGTRGWTPDLIDEAVLHGRAYPAVNKLGGANMPATRYVHPRTGQSVVIDNATGEVIHVGGPGFRY